ncbi:MAG: phosphatidate cytidylyltransferase [Bacteroidales bacterium]|nr:phosphatidate cytidylyltransferase [Bacteroidales bacterium]
MNRNLLQRTITGIFFVVTLVGSIVLSSISFGLLFCLVSAMSVNEFCNLVNRQDDVSVNKFVAMAGAVCLFLGFFYCSVYPGQYAVFTVYIFILVYLLVSELYRKKKNPIADIAYAMMSQLYVALPFALLNLLAFQSADDSDFTQYHFILPLSVFVFIWVNDTGAYCTGMLFGRHRLFERISPKKSWEGSIGGCMFSLLAAWGVSLFFGNIMPMWKWLGLALTIVIFGTWGDLTESLIKRTLGIKDSGNLLPGHGGMLDRFDSALMAIPSAFLYLLLIGNC